jgi:hypothetical protein
MREQGYITSTHSCCARAPPQPHVCRQTPAAWAKDYLRQQFRNEFGGDHPPDWQAHDVQPDFKTLRNAGRWPDD